MPTEEDDLDREAEEAVDNALGDDVEVRCRVVFHVFGLSIQRSGDFILRRVTTGFPLRYDFHSSSHIPKSNISGRVSCFMFQQIGNMQDNVLLLAS